MSDQSEVIQQFTESMDAVSNGVTVVLSFSPGDDEAFRDGLAAFLLDGRFTEEMFRIDEASDRFNYAAYDADSNEFVYPPIANYFVREPIDLDIDEIDESAAAESFVDLLTSTKSPYGNALSSDDADALVREFFATIGHPTDDAARRFYRIEPSFLFASRDDEAESSGAALPYFDNWYFDSATGIHAGPTSHLILTNGFP